jgi:peptidylprolyl isomerase
MQDDVSDKGEHTDPAAKVEAGKQITIKKSALVMLIIVVLAVLALGTWMFMAKDNTSAEPEGKVVLLETNMGDIKIQLYDDMPITTGNFEKLVNEGFYDGVIFHRVIDGFMIQGGDPEGTGMGGPGYTIKDEFTNHNRNDRGTISMANAGPNTGGSQFFINLVDNNFLDGKHPVFGKVIEGMDVVDAIAKVQTDAGDRPIEEVKIISAKML